MLYYLDALLLKYGKIDGRSHRAEFWCFQIVNTIIIVLLFLMYFKIDQELGETLWAFVCHGLVTGAIVFFIIPAYCNLARRFHDFGWGSQAWIMFVPFLNALVLIVGLIPGSKEKNEFGEPPTN